MRDCLGTKKDQLGGGVHGAPGRGKGRGSCDPGFEWRSPRIKMRGEPGNPERGASQTELLTAGPEAGGDLM